MTELERRLTEALGALSAQYERERRSSSEQVSGLLQQVQSLRGQVERLQEHVNELGSDYAQLAGDYRRIADALVRLSRR